jgi:hypothetical protein
MVLDEIERKTPRAIRMLLIEYGGLTPHGRAMWRLVRAGDCRILCQGTMRHFAHGVEQDIIRDGKVTIDRIQGGRYQLPRYQGTDPSAWILQRWFGPSIWGGAWEWKSHRAEDPDTPLFVQEFPASGDYFMVAGPWATLDAAGDLRGAIRDYMRMQRENPRDIEAYIRAEMAAEIAERQRAQETLEREINAAEESLEQVWKSTSLAAQQARDRMAAAAGLNGHFGASEDWGESRN